MTWGNLVTFFVPQFSQLRSEENNSTHLTIVRMKQDNICKVLEQAGYIIGANKVGAIIYQQQQTLSMSVLSVSLHSLTFNIGLSQNKKKKLKRVIIWWMEYKLFPPECKGFVFCLTKTTLD